MNALIKAPMDGEILSPDETVSVYGTTHPLNAVAGSRIHCCVQAGSSITEILLEALSHKPGWHVRRDLIVRIGDHEIPEANWSKVRVKAGQNVTFIPRLQNGGALRTILGVVVAVAALIVAPYAAGLVFAAGSVALTVGSALIAGGIILAGTLALNALFPVAAPAAVPASTPLNSIQGAQNQANPFGPIPVVLGTHRQSPYYAAKPYTEIIGDDQYLRLLFCLGYGPLNIDALQIGETALSAFTDYSIEVRQGLAGDPPVTLYPGEVDEVPLSFTLGDPAQPWADAATSPLTDEISLDFTATQGISATNGQGGDMPWSVSVGTQYRISGIAGPWTPGPSVTFTKSYSPSRRGVSIPVARGQYEVQARKLTYAGVPGHTNDTIVWSAIRSIKSAPPISFPKPLALIALRIKATNQLSGTINTFNCICTSLVTAYNGSIWTANTASQNPADLFRYVLQGPANARPVPDSQINISNLQDWWTYCTANGFEYNEVVNSTGSIYDKIYQIATTGRAVPTFIDGQWGVIWDRPNDSIVQHFTPRNSWGFQGQHPYAQQPHGWRVSFINETNGYTVDEQIVYDDGYNSTNATLFEGLKFPGVTDPSLIWKHGRFQIAQARLRPEKISLSVGWEHLVCTRGDRVRVTHDVLLIGLAAGRVKSVVGQVVAFDETVRIDGIRTFGAQFRVPEDARIIDRSVDPSITAGDYTSLTMVGDLSGVSAGNLFAFGTTNQESSNYRVQGITHQKDLIATLTLVDDAPAISMADSGPIPPYNPNVTIPANPFIFPPRDFRYIQAVDGQGASLRAIIRLSWAAARRGNIMASELQIQSGNADWQPLSVVAWPQLSIDVPLAAPGIWSYRVRFQFSDNTQSSWTALTYLTLLGLSGAPSDVLNIRASAFVDNNISIAWDEVSDYRPIRYAVRQGDSWDSGLDLGTIAHPPFAAHGGGTYLIKAYVGSDVVRAYSVNAATITFAGSSLVGNVIATRDEAANGWLGVFTGTVAKSGTIIRTGGSSDVLSDPDFLNDPDILNRGGQGNGAYEISPSRYIDAGRVTPCRVTITWKGTGQTVTDNMLSNPDILNNPDFLAASSTNLVAVYPEISFAQNVLLGDVFNLDPTSNPSNDTFAEPDIFNAGISFGPWIKYEPGTYVGRYFRARLVLNTNDPQVVAIGLAFTFSVDVPDRLDTWALVGGVGTSLNQVTVPSTGLVIVFASNGKTIAEPFNGGPGTDTVPLIQITNTSSSAFDFEVQSLTLTGCTIVPRLAGTPTNAPKTNISIQGW
jgi:hypothetical protein